MDLINLLSYSFIQHAILAALLMSVACGIRVMKEHKH